MHTIIISDSEIDELLLILNMSAYEADVQIGQSHDHDEIKALQDHKRTVSKWLNRLQQVKAQEG